MKRQIHHCFFILSSLALCFVAYRHFSSFIGRDIQYPFGPDISIWGKAAVMAKYSAPQTVSPAYPELCAALSLHDGLIQGTMRANILSMTCAILGCFLGISWLMRNSMTGIIVACIVSLMAMYTYPFFPYAFYMQPDMMTMGVTSLAIASLIGVFRFRKKKLVLLCGFWMGLAFSTREHGIVLLISSLSLMWWLFRFRSRVWLFLLGVQLGGGLGAGAIFMPFFHPHGGFNGSITKAQVAFMDIIQQKTEENTFQQTQYEQQASTADNTFDFFYNVMMQSLEKSADFHPQILLFFIGSVCLLLCSPHKKRVSIMILIASSPLAISFVVWTQWRHFLVLLPIMTILGWGGLSVFLSRFLGFFSLIPIMGYAGWYIYLLSPHQETTALQAKENILSLQRKYMDEIQVGQELRFLDDGKSLVMGNPIFSILTGMAPITLSGTELLSPTLPKYPSFVYWTYVVSTEPMGGRWEMHKKLGKYYIYQSKQPKNIDIICLKGEWFGPIVENIPKGKNRLSPRKNLSCVQ